MSARTVVLYDVGGGTDTSLDPRDETQLYGGMAPIVPHELGDIGSVDLRPPEWPYRIPGEIDRAVPSRAPIVLYTPRLASWDPINAQRPVVIVDLAGGLPAGGDAVPGSGGVDVSQLSQVERMVRAVTG